MDGFDLLVILFVLLLIAAIVQAVASRLVTRRNIYIDVPLPKDDVLSQLRTAFRPTSNLVEQKDSGLTVVPKRKNDAPTLHIDLDETDGGGTEIHVWNEYSIVKKNSITPSYAAHAPWCLRQQRRIQHLFESSSGTPQDI